MQISEILSVALIGLIVAITVHIVVIARWSGKIDGYILAMTDSIRRLDGEILELRKVKHETNAKLQQQMALINLLEQDRRPQWERRTESAG